MKILDKSLSFDRTFNQSHQTFAFNLEREYRQILISFSYSPKKVSARDSKADKLRAIERYLPDKLKEEAMISSLLGQDILNLVTLSVRKDEIFIGNYHNQSNYQKIRISKAGSSTGFNSFRIRPGLYEIILSFHNISTPLIIDLKVAAYD